MLYFLLLQSCLRQMETLIITDGIKCSMLICSKHKVLSGIMGKDSVGVLTEGSGSS